ncbi:MAG: cysteine desulfurase [Muribaculaceae bacterium]|nr:cysteine desulfurase [Bacteroides sp.]MDE6804627.1 cysteine desulfurase [Muribaculaceae bacterium]MDE7190708.1 cysteine desulfurase [Muribaculaceae bacterium]
MALDIAEIRTRFPILERKVEGRPLIYLDNTATSQTPRIVVDDIVYNYEHCKANVHRGVHALSQEATERQEHTRRRVCDYIHASGVEEIIFTRGTTEAINLVASSYGDRFRDGDEIVLTVMEHHANIVPWQLLQRRRNIKIRVALINERGEIDLDQYRSLFTPRTVMASFCHVSNVLGTINPVKEMTRIAHEHGAAVLIDGAQASPHLPIDVKDLDCDFYVFSSHKMYGPTGIGVLYGRRELLESMPPYQGGGEMIKHVSFEGTTFADLPFKFEAGTPDFVGIAAFSKALDFIDEIGLDAIEAHELKLLQYTTQRLTDEIKGLRIYGTSPHKSAVISFLVGETHPYDVGMLLDKLGVAVRTGHHCAQPLMEFFGIPGTVRASFAVYNTMAEADAFVDALKRVMMILG